MVKVPDGHIWVEGDNPWNSNDSRNYGAIPASLIVGRVVCRIWPIKGKAMILRFGKGDVLKLTGVIKKGVDPVDLAGDVDFF